MRRKAYFLLLFFLLIIPQTGAQRQELVNQTEVRAAIDFGSGVVKMQVAVVDKNKNRIIGKPLLSKRINLSLTEDVAANNGRISKEMEKKALSILSTFKEEAEKAARQAHFSEQRFSCIATAIFRKAENGYDVLHQIEQQLGMPFEILSQDQEGKLGFMTACVLFPTIPVNNLLAWDSGNGSFQITAKEDEHHHIYQGPLGYGTVRVILSKDVRKGPVLQADESGNPVSPDEANELIKRINELLPPLPKWLEEKLLSDKTMIGAYGDGESIFAIVANANARLKGINEPIEEALISESDIQKVLTQYQGATDAILDAEQIHRKVVTSALFLSTVMKHLKVQTIHYHRANGNTAGMLLNPTFWPIREGYPVSS